MTLKESADYWYVNGTTQVSKRATGALVDEINEYITNGGIVLPYKTDAELQAEAQEAARDALKQTRDTALLNNEYALADGSVYQVRPSDLANFQVAIQTGTDRKWVLKDNTTRLTTVAELTEIMSAGIAQAEVIWDDYVTAIGNL